MNAQSVKAPEPLDAALGAAIRIRRRALNISQESLAEQCGVSFQQVQKYENGVNRVSFSRLAQIAQALRCRVSDLVDALEDESHERADLVLMARPGLPGAQELLMKYEALSPEARAALLQFLGDLCHRLCEDGGARP